MSCSWTTTSMPARILEPGLPLRDILNSLAEEDQDPFRWRNPAGSPDHYSIGHIPWAQPHQATHSAETLIEWLSDGNFNQLAEGQLRRRKKTSSHR